LLVIPILDELDVRIFRAILTGNLSAPFSTHLKASLQEVARRLRADDTTVRNRFNRFQEQGFVSGWFLLPNPNLFGYDMTKVIVDTSPGPKEDMLNELKLVRGVVVILDFQGDSLGLVVLHDSEEALSRTIELISRITHAENITRIHARFPAPDLSRLTDTDWAIVRNLEKDALKPYLQVAKELGVTPRTVKNRLQRLERQNALVIQPTLDLASIDRMVCLVLFYSYTSHEVKSEVDQAMLSHFDSSYLWGTLTDPERAYLVLVAANQASVKQHLKWTKQLRGVAGARAQIVVENINLWEKTTDLFGRPSLLLQSSTRRGTR
jgi:DNA-binding Lrp family transcriptional regulator